MVQGRNGDGPVIGNLPSTWRKFAYPQHSQHGLPPGPQRQHAVLMLCPGCDQWLVTDKPRLGHPECRGEAQRRAAEDRRRGTVKPCLTGGCPHPAVRGRARCSRHGPAYQTGGSKDYGWSWQKLRKKAEALLPMVCGICRRAILPGQPYHLDHIVPRSLGGLDSVENVQWAHQHCNISKGGRNRLK